ncbi:MAG: hypothetical protein ACXQS8_02560 [Candidatus Helarchaeales archaeon]
MSFGIYTIFMGLLLTVVGAFFIKDTKRSFKINRESGYSTFVTGVALCGVGGYYFAMGLILFIISFFLPYTTVLLLNFLILPVPQPLIQALFIFSFLIFCFIAMVVVVEYKLKMYESQEAQDKSIQAVKVHKLDLELARKLFHTIIDGIVICYLFVGELVYESAFHFIEIIEFIGSNPVPTGFFTVFHDVIFARAGQVIVNFAFIAIFMIIVLTDLLRVHAYRYYPLKPLANIYREKERYSIGPHVFLVTGALFVSVIFPPIISMVAITVAALGDAMATIVGVTMGKRKIHPSHPDSRKTVEGCIGGVVGSFVFSIIIFLIMTTVPTIHGQFDPQWLLFGIIISIIGATVMFLTDYFSPPLQISDNIINPIICAVCMLPIYILFYPNLFINYYTFGILPI